MDDKFQEVINAYTKNIEEYQQTIEKILQDKEKLKTMGNVVELSVSDIRKN